MKVPRNDTYPRSKKFSDIGFFKGVGFFSLSVAV